MGNTDPSIENDFDNQKHQYKAIISSEKGKLKLQKANTLLHDRNTPQRIRSGKVAPLCPGSTPSEMNRKSFQNNSRHSVQPTFINSIDLSGPQE